MHFFDPARPGVLRDRPYYIGPDGTAWGALSGIRIFPEPDGSFTLEIFLARQYNSFSPFHKSISSSAELWSLLQQYVSDPEQVLVEHFGWKVPQKPTTIPQPKIDLEDLGL